MKKKICTEIIENESIIHTLSEDVKVVTDLNTSITKVMRKGEKVNELDTSEMTVREYYEFLLNVLASC
jgi:hypothetical protein